MRAEVSTLIYRAIQHGWRLIPILIDADAPAPLREPYLRRSVDDHEAVRASIG